MYWLISPFHPGKSKLESSRFSQLQLHLAREPRTPVDRGNRVFLKFRLERAYYTARKRRSKPGSLNLDLVWEEEGGGREVGCMRG
jgi:hypothetical protein